MSGGGKGDEEKKEKSDITKEAKEDRGHLKMSSKQGIYGVSWLQPGRYSRKLQPMYQHFKAWRREKTRLI